MSEELLACVTWLGGSGLLIEGPPTVYVDPVGVPDGLPKADIVFLTRPDEGRCSPKDVAKVATAQTIVVGPRACVSGFRLNQLPVAAGESRSVLGVGVRPLASGTEGALGFLIELGGTRLYHTGGAGAIEGLEGLAPEARRFVEECVSRGARTALTPVRQP